VPTLPLHPAVVHVPLGLALAVPLVAAALALALRAGKVPRRSFALVVGLQVLVVAGGLAAFQLGERDEHRAERVVPKALIEAHEERAEAFLWAAAVVLAGAVAVLVLPARAAPAGAALVAAAAIAASALAIRAGQAGGELVYVHGAAAAWAPAAPGVLPARADDRD
jgi:uncharacterized membrane protein